MASISAYMHKMHKFEKLCILILAGIKLQTWFQKFDNRPWLWLLAVPWPGPVYSLWTRLKYKERSPLGHLLTFESKSTSCKRYCVSIYLTVSFLSTSLQFIYTHLPVVPYNLESITLTSTFSSLPYHFHPTSLKMNLSYYLFHTTCLLQSLLLPPLSDPVHRTVLLSFPLLSSPFLSIPLNSSPFLSFPLLSSPFLSSLSNTAEWVQL